MHDSGKKEPMATEGKKPGASPRKRRSAARPPAEEVLDGEAVAEDEGEVEELLEPTPEDLEAAEAELADAGDDDAGAPQETRLARSSPSDLTSRDPMQAYMAEVTRHPLLSRDEELALARHYQKTGDVKAAYRLVAANLRLVVKLAHEYHRNPLALLDLVQEGNIGLMQAVKKYDPERGVKLSSYAAWWIRAYILRYIMDNWKVVKLGTTEAQRKLFFKLRQEQERLLAQGYEATPKLLAERLSVSEKDVVEMDQRLGHDVRLDAPVASEDGGSRYDRAFPSGQEPVDERLGREQLQQAVRTELEAFAQTLEERDRYILENRLTSETPMTLQEIGTHFGFSRERARQLEAALIGKMREHLRERLPDFDLVASPSD